MDGWNEWLTATPADKNGGRKGGETEIELILEASRTGLGWVGLGWMSEFSKELPDLSKKFKKDTKS